MHPLFTHTPTYTHPPTHTSQLITYALRWLCCLLLLELWTHTLYFNAIARFAVWQHPQLAPLFPPLQLTTGALWVLVFMWLKFVVVWRLARLGGIGAGVYVPENIRRCVLNNYDIEVRFVCVGCGGGVGVGCGGGRYWVMIMIRHTHNTHPYTSIHTHTYTCTHPYTHPPTYVLIRTHTPRDFGVGGTAASTSGWCATCTSHWVAHHGVCTTYGPFLCL